MSVSEFLRGLIGEAVEGRAFEEVARADMAEVRRLANAVMATAQDGERGGDDRFMELGSKLRALAARRLGAPQ